MIEAGFASHFDVKPFLELGMVDFFKAVLEPLNSIFFAIIDYPNFICCAIKTLSYNFSATLKIALLLL